MVVEAVLARTPGRRDHHPRRCRGAAEPVDLRNSPLPADAASWKSLRRLGGRSGDRRQSRPRELARLASTSRDTPLETVVHPMRHGAHRRSTRRRRVRFRRSNRSSRKRASAAARSSTPARASIMTASSAKRRMSRPGSHLCGNVRIGARTLVGVGSSDSPGIIVCRRRGARRGIGRGPRYRRGRNIRRKSRAAPELTRTMATGSAS